MRPFGRSFVCALVGVLPATLAAQTDTRAVAERIAAVQGGTVRLAFEARPGVCGNGSSWIRTGEHQVTGTWSSRDVDVECEAGPVRVVVDREGGRSTAIRSYVGGRWRSDGAATDLGMVDATSAVAWLMAEVERGEESAAKNAILPMTIAAADVPWARVLDVARNESRPRAVRTQAVFWAAQAAGEKAAQEIGAIASNDPDAEVRKQAVFALSRHANGVEELIRVARRSKDRDVKQAAYFWLGQSRDPRAMELFAEVLSRP